MPATSINCEFVMTLDMASYSHNVNIDATQKIHSLCNVTKKQFSHNPHMSEDIDKNGGPNNLRAWREYRKMSQDELARKIEPPTTATQISMLESGDRGLSAKWLRKLGDALKVSPGHILDHDPRNLPNDILEIWIDADPMQRRQLSEIAKALIKTGTDQ